MLQPWKHFQKALTWMISQVAWAWAKMGILEPDEVPVYGMSRYENDDSIPEDEEKSVNLKDDRPNFIINRTRLEVCDQEVNLNLKYVYVYTYIISIKIIYCNKSSFITFFK